MADSDFDGLGKGSPPLAAVHPNIVPAPSPPPDIPPSEHMSSTINNHEDHGLKKSRATSGDAVLIGYLGNGQDPDIARSAGAEGLPLDQDHKDDPTMKNPSLPRIRATTNPRLKRLYEDAFRLAEQDKRHTPHPTPLRARYQSRNETGGGHPSEELPTNSSNSPQLVIHRETSPAPEEAP